MMVLKDVPDPKPNKDFKLSQGILQIHIIIFLEFYFAMF